MQKILALSLFAILSAGPTLAETIDHPRNFKEGARVQSKWKQRLMWSSVALVAASFADAHSSWNKRELNSALRSGDGTFGAKGFGVKMGMVGGLLLGQQMLVRSNPDLARALTFTNFGIAGAKTAVAVRNYQVAPPSYMARPQ